MRLFVCLSIERIKLSTHYIQNQIICIFVLFSTKFLCLLEKQNELTLGF